MLFPNSQLEGHLLPDGQIVIEGDGTELASAAFSTADAAVVGWLGTCPFD